MKTIKKIYIPLMCWIMLMATACSDFLDETPISDVADETYWNNEEEANSAIAGCCAEH